MASAINFLKKTLVIVTGASQGIGQTLAIQLAKRLGTGSIIHLIARSEQGLIDTRNRIAAASKTITIQIHSLDLTNPNIAEYEQCFDANDFEQAIIFHNVGQIGTLTKTTELTDIQVWRNYFDLNVFSVGILNSIFVKKLRGVIPRLEVVNLTSLCGRQPFHDMAMYGSGKAARELYFKVFALEEPDVTVLNYSPGPVETGMVDEIVEKVQDEEVRSMFVDMKQKKTILSPEQTVDKLMSILEKGDFKSGDVVDYFDRF